MKLNQSTNLTRRITMSVVALALVAAACSSGTSRDEPNTPTTAAPATGDPVPTREFVTFSGETATLASYTGKPVVLNFWASWCQDDRALATELLQSTGVEWVSAEDPDGELYVDLGGIAMPFTVYISADGQVVEKHNGPLTERQLRDQIASSLG
jgi:thioredoxin-like negative regulator of GroEL